MDLLPSQIIYSKEQITDFILPNLIELKMGNFPCNLVTGYTGSEYKTFKVVSRGNFVIAAEIAGEIEARIARVPKGYVLIDKYTYSMREEQLYKKYGLDRWTFWPTLNIFLQYIKGRKRKLLSFERWLASTDNATVFKNKQQIQKYSFKNGGK
jgi:hypothetical protein